MTIDSGLAALLGAVVGAVGGSTGVWLTLRHETRSKWDSDRQSAYFNFILNANRVLAAYEDITTICKEAVGIEDREELRTHMEPVNGHFDKVAGSLVNLESSEISLGFYGSQKVFDAAQTLIKSLGGITPDPVVLKMDAQTREETFQRSDLALDQANRAVEEFISLCRKDLRIGDPSSRKQIFGG